MFSKSDLSLWESLRQTLKPLTGRRAVQPVSFPKKLKVRRAPERELMSVLDLHGLAVEEAYQTFRRFIMIHHRENTKLITVITGKGGLHSEGLIHKEISGWLETPFFKEKINQTRWLNGGGALEIMLKRKKKNACHGN